MIDAPSLILENPPEVDSSRRRDAPNTEWFALLSKATKKPNRWFRVQPDYESASAARNAAYDINSGRNRSVPENGRFIATSRTVYDEETNRECGALYVMFKK